VSRRGPSGPRDRDTRWDHDPVTPTRYRWGAIAWLLTLQFFVAETVVQLRTGGGYRRADDVISDLGTSASAAPLLMNGSFVVQGLLIGAGAVLLRPALAGLGGRVASASLTAAAVGVVLVGIFPLDGQEDLHQAGAGLHLVGGHHLPARRRRYRAGRGLPDPDRARGGRCRALVARPAPAAGAATVPRRAARPGAGRTRRARTGAGRGVGGRGRPARPDPAGEPPCRRRPGRRLRPRGPLGPHPPQRVRTPAVTRPASSHAVRSSLSVPGRTTATSCLAHPRVQVDGPETLPGTAWSEDDARHERT
jgi:hypothetical protein